MGPDAPTLCEGWKTRDLAVHLVMRDRDLPAMAGEHLKLFAKRHERVDQVLRDTPWPELIGKIASGPTVWNPSSWGIGVDSLMNTAEFLIHHEDVRRAQPGWRPRQLGTEVQKDMLPMVRSLALAYALRRGIHLVLQPRGFDEIRAGRTNRPTVTVSGLPVELLLYLFGRESRADVEVKETDPLTTDDDAHVEGATTAEIAIVEEDLGQDAEGKQWPSFLSGPGAGRKGPRRGPVVTPPEG
ncbi:hypothetical protein GCM10009823_20270 [Brevibacterium salitolerans]|uniref:TIGR03085 family protein n=1 Tax=Brevibacterium salitolerans TaxID=1403566 RepID=A0ABN2WTG4_9MICO